MLMTRKTLQLSNKNMFPRNIVGREADGAEQQKEGANAKKRARDW